MNNTNINSSILGLIFIILIIVYVNIQDDNNNNMKGGINCKDFTKEMEKILKNDKIYNLFFGRIINIVVYIVIVIVLIYFAYIYCMRSMKYSGFSGLGVNIKGMTLYGYGNSFFNMYTNVSKDKFMFADDPKKLSVRVTEEDKANYETFLKELRTTDLKQYVDKFCQIVRPCDDCLCDGNEDAKCKPNQFAQKIIDHKQSLGISNKFFGLIPNCCCAKQKDINVPGCAANDTKVGSSPNDVTPDEPCKKSDGVTPVDCDDLIAKNPLMYTPYEPTFELS
jgi:hypothetical protein